MNVNSVEVTNFRQILTLLRALIMEMCGLFRVVTSQNTLPICHPRFRFPLRGGERNISARQVYAFKVWTNVLPEETRLKLSANSLPIRRLPIRQAEVVCQFDLSEKYSHYL